VEEEAADEMEVAAQEDEEGETIKETAQGDLNKLQILVIAVHERF